MPRRLQSFLHLTKPDAIRCSRNLGGSCSPAHLQAIRARYAPGTRHLQSLVLKLPLLNSGALPPRASLEWPPARRTTDYDRKPDWRMGMTWASGHGQVYQSCPLATPSLVTALRDHFCARCPKGAPRTTRHALPWYQDVPPRDVCHPRPISLARWQPFVPSRAPASEPL